MKLVIAMGDGFELWTAPPWFSARLRHDFPTLEVEHPDGESWTGQAVRNAEVAICWSLPPEQFQSAHKLRWIYSPAAGGHQLRLQELVKSDVTLTNGRDVHGPVVAGHVVALIFALARTFPQASRLQQKHIWGKQLLWNLNPRPAEIAGAILGLIGLGNIGGEVARHSAALGMRVIATGKHADKDRSPDQVFPSQGLEKLLHQSITPRPPD